MRLPTQVRSEFAQILLHVTVEFRIRTNSATKKWLPDSKPQCCFQIELRIAPEAGRGEYHGYVFKPIS